MPIVHKTLPPPFFLPEDMVGDIWEKDGEQPKEKNNRPTDPKKRFSFSFGKEERNAWMDQDGGIRDGLYVPSQKASPSPSPSLHSNDKEYTINYSR